jgi:hypothetical protein
MDASIQLFDICNSSLIKLIQLIEPVTGTAGSVSLEYITILYFLSGMSIDPVAAKLA